MAETRRGKRLPLADLRCQKSASEIQVREGLPLAAASCKEMAEMGRGERLPSAATRCQKIKEMRKGEGGGMRGCRELP